MAAGGAGLVGVSWLTAPGWARAAGRLGLAAEKKSHREKKINFQNEMTGLSQKKYHPGNDPEQACNHRCLIESIATAADSLIEVGTLTPELLSYRFGLLEESGASRRKDIVM